MKIDASYIGRKVKSCCDSSILEVVAVHDDSLWLKDSAGTLATYSSKYWELVEEPKPVQKPSERIREIMNGFSPQMSYAIKQGRYIPAAVEAAISAYLDEVMPALLEKKG